MSEDGDNLADRLRRYPASKDEKFSPRTEFDGVRGYLQTRPLDHQPDCEEFDDLLREFGYDPEKVRIVGTVRTARWQKFDGEWLQAFRFHLQSTSAADSASDIEDVIKRAKGHKGSGVSGGHWMVFQASDLQLGKRGRDGGTDEIVERYVGAVSAAVGEFKALKRHGIEGIQLSFPGDCLEGSVSQGGKNLGFLTSETVPEQFRIFRRLLMHTVEQMAPLVDRVLVTVVNGNHDEAQRTLNSNPGDGWATEAAISLDDALRMNQPAYGHVEVKVPDEWSGHLTEKVGDTVVTVIHGHQWRQQHQAGSWWQKQAYHLQPAGAAQVLQHGHFHTLYVERDAVKTRICSPTLDCGSDYFRERHGAESLRGGLVYLLKSGDVSRLTLV